MVLYGHTPVPQAEWLNNTLCLDTGCVFGGRLTALNYPERSVVSVPAARIYYTPARPFPAASPAGPGSIAGGREPAVLDIGDVTGSRVVETAYLPRVGVREDHAVAALEPRFHVLAGSRGRWFAGPGSGTGWQKSGIWCDSAYPA